MGYLSILLLAKEGNSSFDNFLGIIIVFGGAIAYYVYSERKKEEIKLAHSEYLKALEGTDKAEALRLGRIYVSKLDKKDQLLAETKLQNDLHGMDDARRN